jgi:anti-sigma B factor antagonist
MSAKVLPYISIFLKESSMSEVDHQGFQLDSKNGVSIVRFDGPKVPPEMAKPLYRLVDEEGRFKLLLDFRQVNFLSSNGIAILVMLKKRLDSVGGILAVCGLDPDLVALLKLTGVDKSISIYAREEEALSAL